MAGRFNNVKSAPRKVLRMRWRSSGRLTANTEVALKRGYVRIGDKNEAADAADATAWAVEESRGRVGG